MNPSDNDRELDTAWRAASRDEPLAAIDDALRAAARRAVGAGPSRAKHMRTWPLAAAAVMAVFAIGLLQLTPPEQVTPGMDVDSLLPRQKAQEAAKPAGTPAAVIAEPAKADAPVVVAANSDVEGAGSAKRDTAIAAPSAAGASGAAPASPPATATAPAIPGTPDAVLAKRTPAAAESTKRSAVVGNAPESERFAGLARKELAQAPSPTPPEAAQPQGAARMRDQARSDAGSATPETFRELDKKNKLEAGAMQAEAQADAKARAEPFPAASSQDKVASAAAPASPAPVAAPLPPPPQAAQPALAAMSRPAGAPAETSGALSARRDAAPATLPEKLAQDTPPRPADEWIKLIRKLQSEGRNEEAAKELTAFRAAYKERADALLPVDLRANKP